MSGDVILGGLFPVHEKSERSELPCGEQLYDRGLQRLEAMLYAVDRINDNKSLLPDIKLGVHILDTCSRDTYALNQSLEFIRSSLNTLDVASEFECARGEKPRYRFNNSGPVLGVVGGSYSSVSQQSLSDKSRFELFARVVPPDTFQALALVDIVNLFNWTYVSTIASEGSYGESGIDVFQEVASRRNICVAVQEKIPSSADDRKFQSIITNLLVKSARAIVLFTRADDARGLLAAAKSLGHEDTFYWIASDGWGKQQQVIKGLEEVAVGAITVELESKKIDDFDAYMFGLRPESNKRNPWFREYWHKLTGCPVHTHSRKNKANKRFCGKETSLKDNTAYEQDSKVQFVIDAVYAFAFALQKLKEDVCPRHRGICQRMKSVDGGTFYKDYLLKTSFIDIADSQVKFDSSGDGLARYTIYNYQKNSQNNGYDYKAFSSCIHKVPSL